ncbi:hypothetical protein PoB_002395900 [Plakobranchus ocellatus]|uniref:Uncharacterized protein n=1 Tax=Plakobranchus ocellatus TaxID=259542 RepID=A0AAV3ZQ48_9GAST|nr:hypothetical protein PoB_002395900 [Plakobranchus ocellatus]
MTPPLSILFLRSISPDDYEPGPGTYMVKDNVIKKPGKTIGVKLNIRSPGTYMVKDNVIKKPGKTIGVKLNTRSELSLLLPQPNGKQNRS